MTTFLTIDAGVAFKLIAPHPGQAAYVELFSKWRQIGHQLCAPMLWAYEITSAFTKVAHFGHMSYETSREGILLAYQLEVQLFPPDEAQASKAFEWTERLHRAAAYDSYYLALAETLGCELWTVDKRLVNAARRSWVRLVPELSAAS